MSEQENAATIRSIYEAFGRGDIAYILEQLDPSVEWHAPTTVPFSKGLHRGPEEVAQFFAGIAEHVSEPSVETYEFLPAGDGSSSSRASADEGSRPAFRSRRLKSTSGDSLGARSSRSARTPTRLRSCRHSAPGPRSHDGATTTIRTCNRGWQHFGISAVRHGWLGGGRDVGRAWRGRGPFGWASAECLCDEPLTRSPGSRRPAVPSRQSGSRMGPGPADGRFPMRAASNDRDRR
jgi:ketosteroid isomerase-like protein